MDASCSLRPPLQHLVILACMWVVHLAELVGLHQLLEGLSTSVQAWVLDSTVAAEVLTGSAHPQHHDA